MTLVVTHEVHVPLESLGLYTGSTTHACACRACDPDRLSPTTPRQGEHHTAVRFGDARRIVVYVDGQRVSCVYEAIAGDPGCIWRYTPNDEPQPGNCPGHHVCQTCGREPCAEVVFCSVAIGSY